MAQGQWRTAAVLLALAIPGAAMAADADVLREAQDRAAIQKLMWNYVRAIDGFNPDAYAKVFTPDGSFGQTRGSAALSKMVTDLKRGQDERRAKGETVAAMHHVMANENIEFVDRDHARVFYYWETVFAGGPGTVAPKLAAAGRGVDDVVRTPGGWLIAKRDVAPKD